ncbi:uncharacterized protein TNCV_584531 [Trichonephila clavipes]|nr:uncharacterized protein TNCV_584531 [Trichonephila clavipes]
MIVLSWIRRESYQLKTFVANRIVTIQESYVSTEDNPADFVSRGMNPTKFKTCELWWNGPTFLMSNQYPQRETPVAVIKDPGCRRTSLAGIPSNFSLEQLLSLLAKMCSKAVAVATEQKLHELNEKLLETSTCDNAFRLQRVRSRVERAELNKQQSTSN